MSQPTTDVLVKILFELKYGKNFTGTAKLNDIETAKQKIKQLYVLKSDVEKAREAEFKLGYEAGESSANGTMKVLSWKEAKQKLNPKTEEN